MGKGKARTLSLCTGYGGLDLGIFGVAPTWISEIDKDASAVLDHHWPNVPNLGDLATIEWGELGRVDHVVAGFPCQPVSQAGKGLGSDDERWLWGDIAEGLGRIQASGSTPTIYLENVRGLISRQNGRFAQMVLRSLSDLGYVCRWGCVRASDVGACHRRERWFCVATHTDSELSHGTGDGRTRRRREPADNRVSPADTNEPGSQGSESAGRRHLPAGGDSTPLLPTPTTVQGRNATSGRQDDAEFNTGTTLRDVAYADTWGKYADAIARHELLAERPAPSPTDGKRLSPRFVEFMMCLPMGWVTDCDLSRTAQLRVLGNGVVPPQASLAFNLISQLPINSRGKAKHGQG